MAKSPGKLVALFLILISAVAVSACVIPFPQQAGKGVEITSFAFSPSSIYGGDQTFLTLTMQNQGSIDASKVYVFLWGFSDDWEGTNTRLEGPTNPFSLVAPKSDLNIEGQEEKISWALTSPELPKDLSFTFTGGARVCYSYKTTASARVEIYAQEEWLRLRGQVSKKPISFSQSVSPLQISVTGEQPLIASASSQIQLQITVKNVGSGTVTTTTCDAFEEGLLTAEQAESLNQLSITIGGAGGGSVSCTLDEPTLFLRKGESGKLLATCNLQNIALEPIATRDIAIELSYQYYVDTQQTVSVMGATTGLIAPRAVYSCQTVCTNDCTTPASNRPSPASGWCYRGGLTTAISGCKVLGFNYKLSDAASTCFESNIYQYLGLISLEGTLTESVCGSNCYCYGLKEDCKAAGTACDPDLMLCVGTETTPTTTCPTSSAGCTANEFWAENVGSYATCGSCKTACTASNCNAKKTMDYTYTDTCCIPQTGGYNCWCGLVK